jgi:phospholipid transport system substrate-binding protein
MKKTIAVTVLAAVMALSGAAGAQLRGGPRQWIQARHVVVNRLLSAHPAPGSPEAAQRDARVAAVLNQMLDLDELARLALEPEWNARTPAEKAQFVGLLRQLIERNYRQNLDATLNFAVSYEAETVDEAAGTAVVRTVARSRTDVRAAPVTIEYRLRKRGSDWIVYDLVTSGASLVQTYHDSYLRIIRERGFPELIRRMEARVAALRTGAAVTP